MVDLDPTDWLAVADLRSLASQGRLADVAQSAPPGERTHLTGAAFALAWPIVFSRITRVNEQRRGHRACAVGLDRLADHCLDRFHDDVEAVVDDLLTHATMEIGNVEGWIASRLRAVTIDAHRRRRGARGALQRPRLPGWLVARLPGDAWFEQLAVQILVWVGVPTTAGAQLWPLDSWAERRTVVTGDVHGSDAPIVQREVDQVLAEMRCRPQWYADYIERPLGMKTPPLAPAFAEHGSVAEPPAMTLTEPDEATDARLADLASIALIAIEKQLAHDPGNDAALRRIITTVFGRMDTGGDFVQVPDQVGDHGVMALVDDPHELRRIVQAVREIVADGPIAA
jgi:hypothetical protein